MRSHGLLNCYQHHAFQQHFSKVPNTVYSKTITTNSPKTPQANTQLSLNIGIKFNLTIKKGKMTAHMPLLCD